MRVLKNLFGDETKIHDSNIIIGDSDKQRELTKVVRSPENIAITDWLMDYLDKNEFMYFVTVSTNTSLPESNAGEWKYGFGIAAKRADELFIVLISNNGRIATRNFRSNTWTSWRVF